MWLGDADAVPRRPYFTQKKCSQCRSTTWWFHSSTCACVIFAILVISVTKITHRRLVITCKRYDMCVLCLHRTNMKVCKLEDVDYVSKIQWSLYQLYRQQTPLSLSQPYDIIPLTRYTIRRNEVRQNPRILWCNIIDLPDQAWISNFSTCIRGKLYRPPIKCRPKSVVAFR